MNAPFSIGTQNSGSIIDRYLQSNEWEWKRERVSWIENQISMQRAEQTVCTLEEFSNFLFQKTNKS